MNYILVDTENIDTYNSLKELYQTKLINEGFKVILFKSNNSKPIKPEFWDILFNKSKEFKSVEVCGSGPQNMDIQIAGYVGYLISLNSNQSSESKEKIKIYLYSNDNHLDNLSMFFSKLCKDYEIHFLKEEKAIKKEKLLDGIVLIDDDIDDAILCCSDVKHPINDVIKYLLRNSLTFSLSEDEIDKVITIMNKYKNFSTKKSKIHNELVSEFIKGREIYEQIKKYL